MELLIFFVALYLAVGVLHAFTCYQIVQRSEKLRDHPGRNGVTTTFILVIFALAWPAFVGVWLKALASRARY